VRVTALQSRTGQRSFQAMFHRCFRPCLHAKEVINPGIRSLEKSLLVCAGQIVE